MKAELRFADGFYGDLWAQTTPPPAALSHLTSAAPALLFHRLKGLIRDIYDTDANQQPRLLLLPLT